jgi:hypothetical protein
MCVEPGRLALIGNIAKDGVVVKFHRLKLLVSCNFLEGNIYTAKPLAFLKNGNSIFPYAKSISFEESNILLTLQSV